MAMSAGSTGIGPSDIDGKHFRISFMETNSADA
jgi:hypothetical protein